MNALELRRRTLGKGVYKKTVEGNPAIAQGSLARMYPGIKMQGWTEQPSTEGNQLFDIEFAKDSGNYQKIVQSSWSGNMMTYNLKPNTAYTLSCSEKADIMTVPLNIATESERLLLSSGGIFSRTLTTGESGILYVGFIGGELETNISQFPNEYTDIMLNSGSTALPYEPYTGGAPSPSPDYPQEITSAGKYDEGTGKYQYEINVSDAEENPTKSQTVTLTADRPLTKWDRLEKRGGVWGWVYKSDEYTMTGEEAFHVANESYIGELTSDSYINVNNLQERNGCCGFSNYLKIYVGVWGGNFDGVEGFAYNGTQIHVRISNEDTGVVAGDTTGKVRDKIKAYCAQRYADGTPFIFWHETSEETFVPLSESEQEAMNALYTFRPTTVLSNDCECNMKLTYKTKKSLEVTD